MDSVDPSKRPSVKQRFQRTDCVSSVYRQLRRIKEAKVCKRVSLSGAVYSCAVQEYVLAELFHVVIGEAIRRAPKNKRIIIRPQDIRHATQKDPDFERMFKNIIIAGGGVVPFVHPALLKNKKSIVQKSPRKLAPAAAAEPIDGTAPARATAAGKSRAFKKG